MATDAIKQGLAAKGLNVEGMIDHDARDSSHGIKLGIAGEAKVCQYIIEGYTNSQINRLLVKDNILKDDDSLSKITLAKLRRRPECQVDAAKLTDEAVLVGHMTVSEVIVGYVNIWRQFSAIIDGMTDKDINECNPVRMNTYLKALDDSSKKILDVFAPNLPDRIAEEIARLREANVSNIKERNYANDALQHVVGIMARFIKGEIERDVATAKIEEFIVVPPPTDDN